MGVELDLEIVDLFVDEALDLIAVWEKECLAIEKNMDNPDFDALFRCAHNLKGSAMSVGLEVFGNFIHEVEDTIKIFQEDIIKVSPVIIAFLLEAQSVMEEWLPQLKKEGNFIYDHKKTSMKAIAIKKYATQFEKGALAEFKNFGTLAVESGIVTKEQVSQAIELQNRKLGEIMVNEGMTTNEEVDKVLKKQKSQPAAPTRSDERIRVSARKVDELIQLIGELSIHQSIVKHAKQSKKLEGKIAQNAINMGDKICKEVQTFALSLRMFPVDGLFQKLERTARDLARAQGKQIDVVVQGGHVDLDKTIIEQISDPLNHMIRNSIDHGVENPDIRKERQKNERATVKLEARQDASGVLIVISDDGKGLDKEGIKAKALEKGLISKEQDLSDEQIYHLIFEAGFSTVAEVTDVSGRGVGMDVVRRAVDTIGGFISIESIKGKGSKFIINLPTSLSIIEVLTILVEEERYLVPLADVNEVIDLSSYRIETTTASEEIIDLRGKIVPVHKLIDYFKMKIAKNRSQVKNRPALIVEVNREKIAFEVDGIIGQGQIVIRPLNDYLEQLDGYSGGTILTNGEAGMIIGLKNIAQRRSDSITNTGIV